jgi:hypothetical protein
VCKKSLLLVALWVFGSLAFVQQSNAQRAGASRGAEGNCAFTFSSGHKQSLTQYCVTANGNIAQFSAGGSQEFLNLTGPATEGYGICDLTIQPSMTYWDYGSDASTNWNPATAVATPTSVTITRTTADGTWQLVQTISERKATSTLFGAAKVTMAIKNLSVTDRIIFVNRHAYIQGGFNDYNLSRFSAYGGPSQGGGNQLVSTALFVRTAFDFSSDLVITTPGGAGPNPCGPYQGQRGFFEGDGAVEQIFSLDVLPGKTKTVGVTYRPF